MDKTRVDIGEAAGQATDSADSLTDTLRARIVSDPAMPKDVIRLMNDAGELLGEIVMDAHDETTDEFDWVETS